MDTHDAIIDAVDAATDPKRREALVSLSFTVQAWGLAVYSYFNSSQQIGSNIPVKVKEREFKRPKFAYFPQDVPSAELSLCPVDVDGSSIDYPSSAAFKGMVGTVIMKFDLDAQGHVTKSEVLGSVPARHFADAVTKAAPGLRISARKGAPAGCRIERKDWVFTVMFRIL